LALHAHASATSPTLRGKFVRETLLCQGIPAPPNNVDTTLPDASMAATTRERFSIHSDSLACSGCHQMMDPIGLGLENFDAVGRYRTTENGVTIDASGELDGVPFTGPEGLGAALRDHPRLADCLTRSVYRYAFGRLEVAEEEPGLSEITTRFVNAGYDFRELLAGVALHPNFQSTGPLD
jgi:hypothetical protein